MSLLLGLVIVLAGHAPQPLVACSVVFFALMVAIVSIQRLCSWNISIHGASAGAATSISFLLWGPALGLLAVVLTLLIVMSRVRIHRSTSGLQGHEPLEAVSGALLGAALGGSIYVLLS
ncbi:hypothetical protein [Nonomuraea maheshkhaliensis]|uniref:hypothetical protein n=1 Tax=Nonomuraea maheshkhaliensis TaxID=419590 RepID=UPI0031F826EE